MQSNGNTEVGASPDLQTENDGPSSSFFLVFLTAIQNLTSSISSLLVNAWSSTTSLIGMPLSYCQAWLLSCFTYIWDGFVWLGSSTLSFLSWLWQWIVIGCTSLLKLPYSAFEYLSYFACSVYSFLSSSATYLYGFLPFATSNDSGLHETDSEKDAFSFIAWVSNLSPAEQLSGAYVKVTEAAQSSGTVLWDSWLWLVVSIGEVFSALASLVLWGLSSILAAILYILTGLWMMLTYIWLTLVGIIGMFASALSSLAPKASTPASVHVAKVSWLFTSSSTPKVILNYFLK